MVVQKYKVYLLGCQRIVKIDLHHYCVMNDSMVYGDLGIELKCEPWKDIKAQDLANFIAECNFTNAIK